MSWVGWLFGIAIGVAFVLLDPAQTIHASVLWPHVQACGIAGLGAWTCSRLGATILHQLIPRSQESDMRWAHALVTGVTAWSLILLVLGSCIGINQPMIISVFFAMALSGRWAPKTHWPNIAPTIGLFTIALLIPGMVAALAPATSTDAIYTHLAIPHLMLSEGELVGGLLHPQGSRPLALHLPYAALMALGGQSAAQVFHWLISGAVLVAVLQFAHIHLSGHRAGTIALLLLGTSWTFLAETAQIGTDLPTALAVLCAMDAALRGERRLLAIAAGAAIAFKYTAFGPIAGVFLVANLSWKQRLKTALLATALVAPWWIRNVAEGLHPLFPFVGWPNVGAPMVFQHLDKYGAGRGLMDFVRLPWNAIMTAHTDNFRFLGRLSPAFLVLAPFAVFAARRPGNTRRLCIAAGLGCLAWAMGPHWLRYLLPTLPIMALAVAAALAEPRSNPGLLAGTILAGVLGVPANIGPIVADTGDRVAVVLGRESKDAFLSRHISAHGAVRWANLHLPADARVAMLFSWDRAHLERRQILGSVEDHTPTRHWILDHKNQSVQALTEAGASHAILRRVRFIERGYPFLSESVFKQAFERPVQTLNDALLMEAHLLFQDGQHRVYALPPKNE